MEHSLLRIHQEEAEGGPQRHSSKASKSVSKETKLDEVWENCHFSRLQLQYWKIRREAEVRTETGRKKICRKFYMNLLGTCVSNIRSLAVSWAACMAVLPEKNLFTPHWAVRCKEVFHDKKIHIGSRVLKGSRYKNTKWVQFSNPPGGLGDTCQNKINKDANSGSWRIFGSSPSSPSSPLPSIVLINIILKGSTHRFRSQRSARRSDSPSVQC